MRIRRHGADNNAPVHRVIQNSSGGHCSEEDAVAALELVQLKVAPSPPNPAQALPTIKKKASR
jgi:hypothetical protein